jgi:hypothetical protein
MIEHFGTLHLEHGPRRAARARAAAPDRRAIGEVVPARGALRPSASKLAAPDAAFSPTGARAALLTYAVWDREQDDNANVAWSQALVADLEPLASGFYIGETDLLANADRARRSFAEPNWLRINELRIALDPDGLFHSYPDPDAM